MRRRVGTLRWLIRQLFRDAVIPVRGEAGGALWVRPAEYPTLLLGPRRAERDIGREWSALLRPDERVFDVGANIGVSVQRFCGLLGGRCRVWAFEPIPRNLELLERNVRRLSDRVTVVRSAVGDRVGRVVMSDNRHHGGLSRLRGLGEVKSELAGFWSDAQDVEVAMLTLDAFVADAPEARPTFLKLDVEGAGHLVLRGAARVLEQCRPVVSCSYHTEEERRGVIDALSHHGYRGVSVRRGVAAWCGVGDSKGSFAHPSDPRTDRFPPEPAG
jgi:FkbM family methyltransferase